VSKQRASLFFVATNAACLCQQGRGGVCPLLLYFSVSPTMRPMRVYSISAPVQAFQEFLSRLYVVSTVTLFDGQRWTKAVFAALFLFSLSAILQHSSRLGKRVMTERACCLNRAPVAPARAPPLSRVRSCANGPGLDHRGCPPQPSPIRRLTGQGVVNRSVACAAANEIP
jgi:hypothetical protein